MEERIPRKKDLDLVGRMATQLLAGCETQNIHFPVDLGALIDVTLRKLVRDLSPETLGRVTCCVTYTGPAGYDNQSWDEDDAMGEAKKQYFIPRKQLGGGGREIMEELSYRIIFYATWETFTKPVAYVVVQGDDHIHPIYRTYQKFCPAIQNFRFQNGKLVEEIGDKTLTLEIDGPTVSNERFTWRAFSTEAKARAWIEEQTT